MKIALTTDHAGFELLKILKSHLEADGHECIDFGPRAFDPNDDYPGFIAPAARAVASGECERAIIMGGSGQGEAMAANRLKGVRCAVYYGSAMPTGSTNIEGDAPQDDLEIIRLSRQHNNANVLSLAARFLTPEQMQAVVTLWLATPYEGVERHARRIAQLDQLS